MVAKKSIRVEKGEFTLKIRNGFLNEELSCNAALFSENEMPFPWNKAAFSESSPFKNALEMFHSEITGWRLVFIRVTVYKFLTYTLCNYIY